MRTQPVQLTHEEVAGRLRIAVNRLQRRLRQESLTEAGMVTRVADPNDRRSARVRITTAGERALERIRTRKNAFLLRRLGDLTAEEQQHAAELVKLLEHILEEP
jgi:DNA-binding MarR family transcriptional regulator